MTTTAEYATQLRQIRAITGRLLDPLSSYLLHRGLPALPLRVRRQEETARALAHWLEERRQLKRTYYPGFPECDEQKLVASQMYGPGRWYRLNWSADLRLLSLL